MTKTTKSLVVLSKTELKNRRRHVEPATVVPASVKTWGSNHEEIDENLKFTAVILTLVYIPIFVIIFSIFFPLRVYHILVVKWTWLFLPVFVAQMIGSIYRWVRLRELSTCQFFNVLTELAFVLKLDAIVDWPWFTVFSPVIIDLFFVVSSLVRRAFCKTNKAVVDYSSNDFNIFTCSMAGAKFFSIILAFIPFYLAICMTLKKSEVIVHSWWILLAAPIGLQVIIALFVVVVQQFIMQDTSEDHSRQGEDLFAKEDVGNRDYAIHALIIVMNSATLPLSLGFLALFEIGFVLHLDAITQIGWLWLFSPVYLSIFLFFVHVVSVIFYGNICPVGHEKSTSNYFNEA